MIVQVAAFGHVLEKGPKQRRLRTDHPKVRFGPSLRRTGGGRLTVDWQDQASRQAKAKQERFQCEFESHLSKPFFVGRYKST